MKSTFYCITAPLFYINGDPHIGHLYSMFLTDFMKKYFLFCNETPLMLLGTDEHGVKVFKSILNRKNKKTYEEEMSDRSNKFFDIASAFKIDFDFFVRTSNKKNYAFVKNILEDLIEKNIVQEGVYQGFYNEIEECFYKKQNKSNSLIYKEEKALFIKNEKFQFNNENFLEINKKNQYLDQIKNILENNKEDLCISRPYNEHGIEINFKNTRYISYVWVDALLCYISYLYKFKKENVKIQFINVIGIDIIRFHCTVLPSFLHFLNLPLNIVYAHNLIISNGAKISKSFNNFQDFEHLLNKDNEKLRMFLLSKNVKNEIIINNNLFKIETHGFFVKKLGNFISRILKLVNIFEINILKIEDIETKNLIKVINVYHEFNSLFSTTNITSSKEIFEKGVLYFDWLNKNITDSQLWEKNIKEEKDRLFILNNVFIFLEIMRISITFLWVIIPTSVDEILEKIFYIKALYSKNMYFATFKKFNNKHYIPFIFV